MDENGTLITTEFVSRGYGEGRRRRTPLPVKADAKAKKKEGSGAGFLLIRLGVCAAAFALILGFKLTGNSEALSVIGELTERKDGDGEEEETPGKLKFVSLPSIIEVFAPSSGPVLPVTALSFEAEGSGGLSIVAPVGSEVVSPAAGRIKTVGVDPDFGRFVSVVTDGDMEFAIYGFDEIAVEEGQPIRVRQKLGTLKGSAVTVRAWKSGRPVDLAELFGLGKAG
ncbi:MAG: M23 family metallopeptidase [Clostridia bacterium]|nr:M23 family metallopeptidase [Clostridia bacterium]